MRVACAIDIGGTRTKLGLVAEDGCVIERTSIATSAGGEPAPLVDGITTILRPMLESAGQRGDLTPSVGVSVAGFLDAEHSAMYGNANLPLLCDFPLRRALEERLGRGCRLEVDSNAAVVAEHRHGAGRGSRRLLGVTIGTGLGGGVILDGRLLRHTGECAGDLGHIIVAPDGRRCSCGARGCLEAMVSAPALAERAGQATVHQVVSQARDGERRALDAIAETAHWLAAGLASLSPLFAPDRIVVGGGVAAAGDLLLDAARARYRAAAGDEFRDRVEIVGSGFDGWEGMLGAASLVFDPLI